MARLTSSPLHSAGTMQQFSDLISCDSLSQRDKRSVIFHLLYAMEAFDYSVSLEAIVDNFRSGYGCVIDRGGVLFSTAQSVVEHKDELDQEVIPFLDNWRFDRLGVATRLILRYGLWELKHTDTDHTVVINEAIELAKCFAERDAHRFINGVLDRWCHEHGRTSSSQDVVVSNDA